MSPTPHYSGVNYTMKNNSAITKKEILPLVTVKRDLKN